MSDDFRGAVRWNSTNSYTLLYLFFTFLVIVVMVMDAAVAVIVQHGQPFGKPGKVREFHICQGKVRNVRKSQQNCCLLVMCYCSCHSVTK